MEYVIKYWKKKNKNPSYYSIEAKSLKEARGQVYHIIRQEQRKMKTVEEMKKTGVKIAPLPDDAYIIVIGREESNKVLGAVILVPGRGSFWGEYKNGERVYHKFPVPLEVDRKIMKKI